MTPPPLAVWLVPRSPAAPAARHHDVLDAAERERAARFRHDPSRDQFVIARATLRRLLSDQEPSVAPAAWRFAAGPRGKPFIDGRASPIEFNCSHADGLIAIALSRVGPVGIDVESLARPIDVRDFARVLSDAERAELDALPDDARHRRFLSIWTAKEAHAKALGTGLDERLAEVTIRSADAEPTIAPAARWRLHRIDAGAGHVATLATSAVDRPIVRWLGADAG